MYLCKFFESHQIPSFKNLLTERILQCWGSHFHQTGEILAFPSILPNHFGTKSTFVPRTGNLEQNFPYLKSQLDNCLHRLTAIRPRLLSIDIVIRYPFFIISNHPLQKWIQFVAIHQRFADEISVHKDFLHLFLSSFISVVPNGFFCSI